MLQRNEECCANGLTRPTLSMSLAERKQRLLAELEAVDSCEKYLKENPATTEFLNSLRNLGL